MPEPVTISRLVPVGVKLVWPMEASSFTPWLLANAAVLGDVLGIDLELRAAEHKVGGFSLDLIGRDAESDEVVIVENQFGPTDHRHLGQLLTYAGGTEPATVVWIAEQFRDEHRAALDWLNARTDSSTRFFGVRLGAVTIQGAPTGLVAPLFELVVQPNDWGKAIKSPTTDPESKRAPLYLRFWGDWLDRVKPHGWTNRKPPPKHWLSMSAGSVARYTVSFRSDGLLSELFFRHEDPEINQQRWEVLNSRRDRIERVFGGDLDFDDLPNRKGCRVGVHVHGSQSIEDDSGLLGGYSAWFEDTQVKLRNAIEMTGGIPPLPTTTQTLDVVLDADASPDDVEA